MFMLAFLIRFYGHLGALLSSLRTAEITAVSSVGAEPTMTADIA